MQPDDDHSTSHGKKRLAEGPTLPTRFEFTLPRSFWCCESVKRDDIRTETDNGTGRFIFDFDKMLTPKEIHDAAVKAGVAKIELMKARPAASAVLALFAGAYIALGGMLSVMVGWGMPGWSATNPGLRSVMCGAVFPIGLILIVVLGGELFTGNNAVLVPGAVHRRFSVVDIVKN